jgi:hypothetical protein
MKGIQVFKRDIDRLIQRGDNHKNVKLGWGHLKIFFSRTTGPISTKLGKNDPCGEGI